jgi:hypothetical protein
VPGIGILTGAVATGTMQPESDAAAER